MDGSQGMKDLSGIDIDFAGVRSQMTSVPANPEISALLGEVLLNEASALARSGREVQALDLLGGISSGAGLPAAGYDLLARIHAQRGQLTEARDAWQRALEMDPGNGAAMAGLSRIKKLLCRSPLRGYLLKLVAFILAAAILAFAAYWGIAAIVNEIDALKVETERLATLTGELGRRMPDLVPVETVQPADEAVSIPEALTALPGISMKPEGRHYRIEFDEGLFAHSDMLTPDASMLLTRLGAILENFIDGANIEIVGHTDDVPPRPGARFKDNYSLAVARAVAVAEHLSATAHIPLSLLAIRGEADFNAPFPNISAENRLRNRTVVIRIGAER